MDRNRFGTVRARSLAVCPLLVCLAARCDEKPEPDDTAPADSWVEDDTVPCELPANALPAERADAMILGDEKEEFGLLIAGVGDLNADGYDDVAAQSAWGNPPRLTVWFGPLDGELDDDDWDLAVGAYTGNSAVGSAGDLDADGFDDLIVGAESGLTGSGDYAGGAYLLYGPVGSETDFDVAAVWLYGNEYSRPGHAVAGFGAAGDEFRGVMISDTDDSTAATWAGAVFVFQGAVYEDTSLHDAPLVFLGEGEEETVGDAVAGLGDVNGDGVHDLCVGAAAVNVESNAEGVAYVINGPLSGTVSLSGADARLYGDVDNSYAGQDVAAAGDVDGDGLADILVGAGTFADDCVSGECGDRGAAYLMLGPVSGDMPLAEADARIYGQNEQDYLGYHVAGPGDYNGDGLGDLLVSAWGLGVCEDYGGALLYFGPVAGVLSVDDADVLFTGYAVGSDLSPAGDADGDGMDDLLLAANYFGGDDQGAAFLWLGREDWGL